MHSINRKIEPPITLPVDIPFGIQPLEVRYLKNKIPVYYLHNELSDVIKIELVSLAGLAFENKNMVAATTNVLLKSGTTKKTALQISEAIEFYGASIQCHCYAEATSVSLFTLPKYVSHLLPICCEILQDGSFPNKELDIFKSNQKERLKIQLRKSDFLSNRLIDEALFGLHHPYGKYTTMEDIDALNQEDLICFYKQFYQNGQHILFVAGNIPTDLFSLLDYYFSWLPTFRPFEIPFCPIQSAQKKKIHIDNNMDSVQTFLKLGKPIEKKTYPFYFQLRLLNMILGGYFGSRLMTNIREDKGLTYGIHSQLQGFIAHSSMTISASVGNKDVDKAIQEIWVEMERLQTLLISEEELKTVKNYILGNLISSVGDLFQVLSIYKGYILQGLPLDTFDHYIQLIKETDAKTLQQLALSFLEPHSFYQVTVR